MSTPTKDSPFMRFASAGADFGDPFYSEERQRDVWNEASAFGFQLLLWGALLLSTVMLWFGGRDALPYAYGLLAVTGLASALTIGYARRLGVDAAARKFRSQNPSRLVLLVLVLVVLVLGLVRSALLSLSGDAGTPMSGSTLAGLVTGALIALATMLVLARRAEQRARRAETDTAHHGHHDGDQALRSTTHVAR